MAIAPRPYSSASLHPLQLALQSYECRSDKIKKRNYFDYLLMHANGESAEIQTKTILSLHMIIALPQSIAALIVIE